MLEEMIARNQQEKQNETEDITDFPFPITQKIIFQWHSTPMNYDLMYDYASHTKV